jgi:hypothetical protein
VSDLSVFHRVDDVAALTISRFLMLAVRLAAYGGALKARFATESAGMASTAVTPTAGVPSAGGGDTPPEVIAQLKRRQFAERHHADSDAIEWDDAQIYRELVK